MSKATLEPFLLCRGDTFKVKDELKGIAGAAWCKPLGGWLIPADRRDEVAAVLDKAGITHSAEAPGTGAEAAAAATTAVVEASSSAAAGAVLTVSPHKKAVLVTGETQKVKELLKALKGSWNKGLGGWCFPGSQRAAVLAALRKDPTNTVTEGEAAAQPPAKRQKGSAASEGGFINDDDSSEPREVAAQSPAKRQKGSAASEGGFINDDDSE
eukprot:CAMPEP_0185341554 /NCGR_PEP_ID=MMETSP1363-20130426/98683_1 /TAXON_ID=38817 /ORGANISM="Gephyrocapsa oceanica, Strain RCC1303" /LENGTH=211 /DNA_ID=CAMNT_0027940781 /DNA_START=39 /DNA_END=675 /DNA_ORIENTATION=-